MKGGGGPDLGPGQRSHLEFEPDGKEQELDSEISDGLKAGSAGVAGGLQDKAGEEESDHRGQSQLPGAESHSKSDGNKESVHGVGSGRRLARDRSEVGG